MGLRVGLHRCGKSYPPSGFDFRTIQPLASRYTDWAIPVQSIWEVGLVQFFFFASTLCDSFAFVTSHLIAFICVTRLYLNQWLRITCERITFTALSTSRLASNLFVSDRQHWSSSSHLQSRNLWIISRTLRAQRYRTASACCVLATPRRWICLLSVTCFQKPTCLSRIHEGKSVLTIHALMCSTHLPLSTSLATQLPALPQLH